MRRVVVAGAVLALAVLVAVLNREAGAWRWWLLRGDLATAEARISELREEVAALEGERAALEGDRLALERAIREDLDLAREGEVVVRFPTTGAPVGGPR